MELQETSTQPAASSFTSLSPPDRPAVASTTTTTSFYAPGPASSSLPPSPSTSTTTTTATKKDAFVRLSPNQAHDTVIIKDEDGTENSFVMNQLAPLPTTSSTLTSPTPPRLPSFHFPPLAPTAAPGPAAPPPLPLTALAPSLFTSTSSSSSSSTSSSSSSTSSSPSSSPMLSPFLTPTTTSPSPPHMAAGSASSSTPVAAPLSQQQQQQAMLTAAQQIARLNSLTQMTSQIAAIALDVEAAKAAWVADMSRSLQTELQSVYLHLHSGGAETAVPPPQSFSSSSSTSPPPSSSFTPGTSPSAPPLLPTPQKLQLSSSPTHSPLQAAAATLPPPPPGFPGHGHGRHLPVQPAAAIMPVLAPTTPSTPASDVAEDKKTGGRRRRKPKTKDSFNHMQRKCASCQRTETTKWRHGPLGSNTLCNTCGLAYSRKKKREAEQAAKQLQQGGNPQAVMPPTPATSASPPTP